MLIIIEGCDGAGKTTLVQRLVEEIGEACTVEHRGVPQMHPLVEYESALEQYVPGIAPHVLCDRWHWGEAIYGPLYRGRSMLGPAGLRHVDLFLQSRGALQVFIDAPADVLRKRLGQRGEDCLHDDDVDRVVAAYRKVYGYFDDHVLRLTHDDVSPRRVIDLALQRSRQAVMIPTYVGPRFPDVLYLGDRREPLGKYQHVSAFVPYADTSGAFLLEALGEAGAPYRYGLANALEIDVAAAYETLGRPTVVALGATAHFRCNQAGVPHRHAPHPQFVRRFQHNQRRKYGTLLVRLGRGEDVTWSR